MRKKYFSILALLVAMFAPFMSQSVVAADAPGLTQLWKCTNVSPVGLVKSGVGVNGLFYMKSVASSVELWGETGSINTSIKTGTGAGITTDDAGNVIVRAEYYGGAEPKNYQIIPAGTKNPQDLTLTLKALGRADYLSAASGDLLSAEGGKLYIFCKGQTAVNVVTIKEGVQTDCVTVATSASTADLNSEAYPVVGDDAAFITHVRGEKAIYKNDGAGNDVKLITPEINSTAGSCMFQLKGVNYIVYNTGDDYADGFSVANMQTGEVVATHANETNPGGWKNGTYANHLSYEIKDDYTVYIYAFTPSAMAAKYKFEIPGNPNVTPDVTPNPDLDDRPNPDDKPNIGVGGDQIYLIGEIEGYGWTPNVGAELVKDGDVYKGIYNITGTFGIITKLGSTSSDWDTCNANRYGGAANDEIIEAGAAVSISKNTNAFKVGAAGVYNVTVDLSAGTIELAAVDMIDLEVTPVSGTYLPGEMVTMACGDADAAIYYTLDGSMPSATSTKYAEPFALVEGKYTLKAIAIAGEKSSLVVSATYNVTSTPAEPITVKFEKPADWSTVTLWAWTADGTNLFSAWPGETMNDDGDGWWSYTFDASVTEVNVIFSNAGSSQTGDTKGIVASTSFKYAGSAAAEVVAGSVEGIAAEVAVMVYPNPVVDMINVEATEGVKSIVVLDITGKVVAKSAAAQVDVSSLPAGLYLVKVNNAKIVKVVKR